MVCKLYLNTVVLKNRCGRNSQEAGTVIQIRDDGGLDQGGKKLEKGGLIQKKLGRQNCQDFRYAVPYFSIL